MPLALFEVGSAMQAMIEVMSPLVRVLGSGLRVEGLRSRV